MVTFWAIVILMLAYALGTLQGMSPEMRKAVMTKDEDETKDDSMVWLLLLAVITTVYLAVLG